MCPAESGRQATLLFLYCPSSPSPPGRCDWQDYRISTTTASRGDIPGRQGSDHQPTTSSHPLREMGQQNGTWQVLQRNPHLALRPLLTSLRVPVRGIQASCSRDSIPAVGRKVVGISQSSLSPLERFFLVSTHSYMVSYQSLDSLQARIKDQHRRVH